MNKSTILLMLSVSMPVLLAASDIVAPTTPAKSISEKIKQSTQEKVSATRETSAEQVTTMQKQIADLQKQLATIANQVEAQKLAKKNHQTQEHHACNVTAVEPKKNEASQFEKGYTAVTDNVGVKVGGMVKLDMIYDGASNTSEQSSTSRIPYDLTVNQGVTTTGYAWRKHFYMHAKQTKLRIDSIAKNSSGRDIKAFIEGDFFGTTNWGDTAVNGGFAAGSAPSSTYTFRLRHAVLAYAGLEAGFTSTTFCFNEAILPSVDLNGVNGGINRHALIRYTHTLGNFAITAAAEHSRPDYVQYNNTGGTTARYAYSTQDTAGNLGKPERPDLILKLKYSFANGSTVGVSGIYRDLQIKYNSSSDSKNYTAIGQGINLAAKIMTYGQSFLTGGIVAGQGIGWYIPEANGRSAFFDPTAGNADARTYKAIPMTMFWAGYSQVWNPQWQTNIGFARINLGTQSLNDNTTRTIAYVVSDPGIDRTFNKFLVNTMYKPEANLEFGLEYFYLQRKSINTNRGTTPNAGANAGADSSTGTGHRFQFGSSYKF